MTNKDSGCENVKLHTRFLSQILLSLKKALQQNDNNFKGQNSTKNGE